MGVVFSRRVGSDPYYANYEKSFERLEKECVLIDQRKQRRKVKARSCNVVSGYSIFVFGALAVAYVAWVQRLPPGSLSMYQHLISTLSAVAAPLLAVAVRQVVMATLAWAERRDDKLLKKLHDNKRRMVKELKDSTRFEKTMALVRKFDPDAAPPTPAPAMTPPPPGALMATGGVRPRLEANQTPAGFGTPLVAAAAGAGRALFPVFDKLASSMIGDNPALLEDLRRAKEVAIALKHENDELRAQLCKLQDGDAAHSSGTQLLLTSVSDAATQRERMPSLDGGGGTVVISEVTDDTTSESQADHHSR